MKINIRKYLVKKNTKISTVIKMLQDNPIKLIVVVTDNDELIGSITDGDLRRGMLDGYNLKDKCSFIMNMTPSYAHANDKDKINDILNGKKNIPIIVDNNNIVTSLYLDGLSSSKTIKNNKVVIMAGGKGTRLEPFTKVLPKPLIPIEDKTVIEHIIDSFTKYG